MSRLRRWLFRAPVYLFRAGLGFLLGERFLMLEHRGRKTGLIRRTVLEVVARRDGAPVVVSGFGEGSEWLKNVSAAPFVVVTWGRRRFGAAARRLSHPEAVSVFQEYRSEHPRAAAFLGRALGVYVVDDIDGAARRMPAVQFDPE